MVWTRSKSPFDEVTETTSDILSVRELLAVCYDMKHHIDDSIEKLQQSQRILTEQRTFRFPRVSLASNIDSYINEGKLFHALKMVEKLRVEITSFRGRVFRQRTSDWVNLAVQTIKNEQNERFPCGWKTLGQRPWCVFFESTIFSISS
ncbi:hypothetical protein PsorP6_001875 [Peronosclerospora sorghi]|uniref:Uncharacterized protein n=1 Tax=Peronosclerospora sorghi TaxID=230839 RepID=A0ACC0WXS0_9STRA|nr:hypothetical protein PsorP6_001875 [Peronosclerospora sorghi]